MSQQGRRQRPQPTLLIRRKTDQPSRKRRRRNGSCSAEPVVQLQRGSDINGIVRQRRWKKVFSAGHPPEHGVAGFVADVRDLSSLQTAIDAAAAHFGRIDIVVANAGIDTVAPMATLEPASFERVIDINLTGVWRTFKAALPHVQKRHGYLLAISSMAAFVHSPLQGSYTASKAGVWAMCDSIRLELRSLGVGVGSAHPTFFKTPLMNHVHKDPAGQELWGDNVKGVWKMVPLQEVVMGIADGIERRSAKIVVPKSLLITANAPGVFRRVIERIGFRDSSIQKAAALASPIGWNDDREAARSIGR
ncbi:SDR family NAD(P)-dependent oxidoreductase [Mycobacterium sp. TY814]|uniref:SDR family NAD(P)-dependent oxidoreductase n=1 Tax=unclassified Mycobacterium TaxID=2642494 RepID=UPI0027424913|nr:SDR family NAD(P)-dependent oxidoreductase [Mycobacterium sp. TY814]